jgi:hypothetical protein
MFLEEITLEASKEVPLKPKNPSYKLIFKYASFYP